MSSTVLARVGAGESDVILDLWLPSHEQLLEYGRRVRDHIVHSRITPSLFAYFVANEVGHGVFLMPWDSAPGVLEVLESECGRLGLSWRRESMHPELFAELLAQSHMAMMADEAAAVIDLLSYITQLGHSNPDLN